MSLRRQARGPSPSTGTGDAPGRSSRLLRPRRPHHLASAAPLPASWASHRTDLRLRPIPLSPEEVREESSMARNPSPTRGFGTFSRHTSSSGVSSTGRDRRSSTEIGPPSTGMRRPCGDAGRPALAQSGRSVAPRLAAGCRRSAAVDGARSGNGRRALVGMSYKGPSAGEPPRASPRPSPSTGTGDAPDRSSRLLRPRRPRHLASAAPLPASWAATVRIFVSDRSRSPRRECVRRVLWPGTPSPTRGFATLFSTYLGFRRVVHSGDPASSTDRPLLHRNRSDLWTTGLDQSAQEPAASKAAATSSRRRSAPNGATIWTPTGSPSRGRRRPAPRSPGSRSR